MVLAARDRADFSEDDPIGFTGDELRDWWAMDEPALATDRWIALRGGEIIGYAGPPRGRRRKPGRRVVCPSEGARPGHRLPPARRGGAVGLRERPSSFPRARGQRGRPEAGHGAGHRLVRFFWRMEIDLAEEPALPEAPAGMTIRDYRPGDDDVALHAMHQEAFAEHWEFTPSPLDEWLNWRRTRRDYHPALGRSPRRTARSPAPPCASAKTVSAGCSTLRSGRPRGGRALAGAARVRLRRSGGADTLPSGSRWTPRMRRRNEALRARRHEGHAPLRDLREGARVTRLRCLERARSSVG